MGTAESGVAGGQCWPHQAGWRAGQPSLVWPECSAGHIRQAGGQFWWGRKQPPATSGGAGVGMTKSGVAGGQCRPHQAGWRSVAQVWCGQPTQEGVGASKSGVPGGQCCPHQAIWVANSIGAGGRGWPHQEGLGVRAA